MSKVSRAEDSEGEHAIGLTIGKQRPPVGCGQIRRRQKGEVNAGVELAAPLASLEAPLLIAHQKPMADLYAILSNSRSENPACIRIIACCFHYIERKSKLLVTLFNRRREAEIANPAPTVRSLEPENGDALVSRAQVRVAAQFRHRFQYGQ